MLSLLLGLAQARTKHATRKQTETQSSEYKIPESLAPFVSKDPRYIKVYRPKESTTAVANGAGVTKCYIIPPYIYVYLDNDASRSVAAGCGLGAIGCSFIPEPLISKVTAAIFGLSALAINYANRGRGVFLKLTYAGSIVSINSQ